MSGLLLAQRRIILTPKNPADVSTVVSIYPKKVIEVKPTLFPGEFTIEAGSIDKPAILEVGSASWFREVNEDEPLLEIPVGSVLVADSIVKDWRNGIHLNGPDQNPGMMFFIGKLDPKMKLTETKEFKQLVEHQNNWFQAIVKDADIMWARSNGNPIVISNDARYAAEKLGLKDKSWMQDFKTFEMVNCLACGALRNPKFPICNVCRTIVDPEAWKKLGLSVAQG